MTRPRSRPLGLALATLALCLAAVTAARGQQGGNIDLKPFEMKAKPLTGTQLTTLSEMKAGKRKVVGQNVKELFKDAAQFYVYKITQDQYYTGGETGELKPKTGDLNLDLAFEDLERYVLVPDPTTRLEQVVDQNAYIHEFGAALDQAVVDVLKGGKAGAPPQVIRVNAARMLAVAARSGAPAHAKTITALLTNTFYTNGGKPVETPPEVLYWALKAAENLLAAADPTAFGTPNPGRHSLKDEDLVPLVKALNGLVLNNPPVADKAALLNPELATKPPPPPKSGAAAPPGPKAPPDPKAAAPAKADPAALTQEQVALIRFYRRQAIRALGKVRYDTVGEGTPDEVRCGYTLAKVAVNDASINPVPSVAEVGEAVIGLCGVNPSSNLNVETLLYVIAYGTDLFFGPRVGNPDDKWLPWKTYAARVAAAYAQMQRNAQINPRLSKFRAQVTNLVGIVTADLTGPIEQGAGVTPPRVERLAQWLQANQPKAGLYEDAKKYPLTPRPRQ